MKNMTFAMIAALALCFGASSAMACDCNKAAPAEQPAACTGGSCGCQVKGECEANACKANCGCNGDASKCTCNDDCGCKADHK